ncbi:MAG: hypothetical protein NTV03_02515 [Candidatus Nomurabacteria bacterium]|nr:hypothetical protein [Candidatus Nomurabacteria bacterium]
MKEDFKIHSKSEYDNGIKVYENYKEIIVPEKDYRNELGKEIKNQPKEKRVDILENNKKGNYYKMAKSIFEQEKNIKNRVEKGELSSVENGWKEIANERINSLLELNQKIIECRKIADDILPRYEENKSNITKEEALEAGLKLSELDDFLQDKNYFLDSTFETINMDFVRMKLGNIKGSLDHNNISEGFIERVCGSYGALDELKGLGDYGRDEDRETNILKFTLSTRRALNKLSLDNCVEVLKGKEMPKDLEDKLWTNILFNNINPDNFFNFIENNKEKVYDSDIETFIKKTLNSENIDKLINEKTTSIIKPITLLEIISKNTDSSDKKVSKVIKSIYESNTEQVLNSSLPLFGEKSLFKGLENKSTLEQEAFNKNINFIVESLEKELPEIRNRINRFYNQNGRGDTPGFGCGTITHILKKIGEGTDNNLRLENYKEIIDKINYLSDYVESTYIYAQQDISELESEVLVKLEKLFNEKPEGLIGKDLELFVNQIGGKNIYHNGEYQLSVGSDAQFSSKPSNGEKISYLTVNKIDSSNWRGDQHKYQVYSFDIKDKTTKEVFEDHSWDQERTLLVSTPEVSEDGIITFKVYSDDGEQEKRID